MVEYSCKRCNKVFKQKSSYVSHGKRKKPCSPPKLIVKNIKIGNQKITMSNMDNDSVNASMNRKMTTDAKHNYSSLSINITKSLSKNEKKANGIYFTPPSTIHRIIQSLQPYMKTVHSILEPSCGSGEFIKGLRETYHSIPITGVEYNKTIFDSIYHIQNEDPHTKLYNDDFLRFNNGEDKHTYDLIIGNPPYFVLKKNEIDDSYFQYFDGRPNIFIPFIIKSLSMLNKNGILCFVLPSSFLNCVYYDKTRKYICENFTVLDLFVCNDNYIETKQETVVITIQNKNITDKGKNNQQYYIKVGNHIVMNTKENIHTIKQLYDGSTTLCNMGFKVSVGNVVWNQCKDILSDDPSNTTLIYSSDIQDNEIKLKQYANPEKKNYIRKAGMNEPLLVINRGYGVGKYNFNYCLLKGDFEYLIENHLIYIKYKEQINDDELIDKYNTIIQSFNDVRTQEFIKLYFGNSAINTTELCEILPIYKN